MKILNHVFLLFNHYIYYFLNHLINLMFPIFPPASQGANLQDYDLVQAELEILFSMLKEEETSFNSFMEKIEVKHIYPCDNQIC